MRLSLGCVLIQKSSTQPNNKSCPCCLCLQRNHPTSSVEFYSAGIWTQNSAGVFPVCDRKIDLPASQIQTLPVLYEAHFQLSFNFDLIILLRSEECIVCLEICRAYGAAFHGAF